MPAPRRAVPISTIEHHADSTIKVQVFYDRREQEFYAEWAKEKYSGETEAEVREQVGAAIKAFLDVPWKPAIEIRVIDPYQGGPRPMREEEFLGFAIDRLWVSHFPNGKYKQCQWDGKEKGNLLRWCQDFHWDDERDGAFAPPQKRVWYHDVRYYLPYRDETWERLQFLLKKIAELRGELEKLFQTNEGLELLLFSPWLALPEPLQALEDEP